MMTILPMDSEVDFLDESKKAAKLAGRLLLKIGACFLQGIPPVLVGVS